MSTAIGGIILAGGGSRRFGSDKRIAKLGGQLLIDRAIAAARAQCSGFVISLGRKGDNPEGWPPPAPIVCDPAPGDQGPLAGVLAGLCWFAENYPEVERIATFPADTPFLPDDYAAQLAAAPAGKIAMAEWRGRAHFTCALWPVAAMGALRKALTTGERRAEAFIRGFGATPVSFDSLDADPFFNINRPEDLAAAEARL